MRILCLCIIVFHFLIIPSNAQEGMKIEHISTEEGLPHRWIHQITQDQNGFIWITTENGVFRYNGHEFKEYLIGSFEDERQVFIAIQQSQDGRFWLAGKDRIVFFWDPNTNKLEKAQQGKDFFIPLSEEFQVIKYNFGTYLPQLKHIKSNQPEVLNSGSKISNMLFSGFKVYGTETIITKRGNGDLWFWYNLNFQGHTTTNGGFHYRKYQPERDKWHQYNLFDFLNIEMANSYLPIDSKGRYWYPAFDNLSETEFDSFRLPPEIPLQNWAAFRVDDNQNIWLYDIENELYRFDTQKRKVENIGKMESVRIEVFADTEGTNWISSENGLRKIVWNKGLFENYLNEPFELGTPPPIGNSMAFIFEKGKGNIFAQLSYGSLFQIIPTSPIPKKILDPIHILSPSPNSDQFFFCRHSKFTERFNIKNGTIEKFPLPETPSPIENLEHKIPVFQQDWKYLFLFDTITKKISRPQIRLKHGFFYPYWDQKTHHVWANYDQGLLKIDLTNLEEFYFKLQDRKIEDYVRGWLPEDDTIWLATLDGLILLNSETGKIIHRYSTEDGLPHNTIYSIVKSGEYIWLGTQNGLCSFHPKTEAVMNYYVEDGLSHNEFNTNSAMVASDGKIWMGGLNGINVFDPKVLERTPKDTFRLQLAEFKKYNSKLDSIFKIDDYATLRNQSFTLRPVDQSFSFQFFINSLVEPSKNNYFYYLEGYEPIWANVQSMPKVSYQNVPPGNYVLKIKATDYRGNPVQNELAIAIDVLEFWYKRWWAWLLYIGCFLAIFFGVYRFQLTRKLAEEEAARLKDLDIAKTRLYTNITHEFRTPLTVILGMAEQLLVSGREVADGNSVGNRKETIDGETAHPGGDKLSYREKGQAVNERRKAVEMIRRNGQNLLDLVNQMLDLSKLESGKISLNLVQEDIVPYLKYLIESFHSLATDKGIEVHFFAATESLIMDFDKEKLKHIISNLLSNAIKFTAKGGTIWVHLDKEEGKQLRISIKDNGIGIAAEVLPSIFDRFYQADNSHTRKGEGTGIGLALVKELVKLMQGKVEVESTFGKGAEFVVRLPIRLSMGDGVRSSEFGVQDLELDVEESSPPETRGTKVQTQPTADNLQQIIKKPQLLIIEDNSDVAHYIQSCLQASYHILLANDGKEGIKKALETIPDIIISDVMMPEKDGFEVLQFLKNDERTSHIPIILLTAKADVTSKLEGLKRGADAYLAKPFHSEELLLRCRKLVELRKVLQSRYANVVSINSEATLELESETIQIEDAYILKINKIIQEHISDAQFGVNELTRHLGSSRSQVFRKLKALTGKSITLYIRSYRLQRAKYLLETTDLNVSEIAYDVGYSNLSYFSRSFQEEFGCSPKKFKQ